MTIDKSVPGWKDEYKSTGLMDLDGDCFYIRLVTVDMDPNDTFYMEVPADYETKTIERLVNDFFPATVSQRDAIKDDLEIDEFPELPEIYDYFCELFDDERCGRLILDYSINGGPSAVVTSDMIYNHLSLSREKASGEQYKVLHIVLESHNVPFGDYDDQVEADRIKKSFRGLFLFTLVHGGKVAAIDPSIIHDEVADAIAYCEGQDLLKCKKALIGDDMKLTLTGHGKKQFVELYNEAAYYVSNFEMFSQVLVDQDYIRFNNVDGKDYRIQAMREEGVDVYRAVMVMSMMNGAFDGVENWEQEIQTNKFFARYFGSCVNTEIDIPQKTFLSMIKEGKKLREENHDSAW